MINTYNHSNNQLKTSKCGAEAWQGPPFEVLLCGLGYIHASVHCLVSHALYGIIINIYIHTQDNMISAGYT